MDADSSYLVHVLPQDVGHILCSRIKNRVQTPGTRAWIAPLKQDAIRIYKDQTTKGRGVEGDISFCLLPNKTQPKYLKIGRPLRRVLSCRFRLQPEGYRRRANPFPGLEVLGLQLARLLRILRSIPSSLTHPVGGT